MAETIKLCSVKNRSASTIIYKIPEEHIRRVFAPRETKQIPYSELEKLSFQAGGRALMTDYLQITAADVTSSLGIHREPEYNLSEEQIINLMQNGSLDQFLDCLDFAPVGVIDLVKKFAVSLPLNDMAKRKALKDKTGFDASKAVLHEEEQKEAGLEEAAAPQRRVAVEQPAEGRRIAPNYAAVAPATEKSE